MFLKVQECGKTDHNTKETKALKSFIKAKLNDLRDGAGLSLSNSVLSGLFWSVSTCLSLFMSVCLSCLELLAVIYSCLIISFLLYFCQLWSVHVF